MKPKIFVIARECYHDGDTIAYQVNKDYIYKIRHAGGIPIIVPPLDPKDLLHIADECDGLLVVGGNDIDPSFYNEEKRPLTYPYKEIAIDAADLKLIKYFHKYNKPILGICRGLQAINVAFGGTLYQDLEQEYPALCPQTHSQTNNDNAHHTIVCRPNTYAYELFGKNYGVNSYHHQAIKTLGKDLVISAKAEDGVVEAIESNNLFAIQWHPERIDDDDKQEQIFIDFIALCKDPY